jgi:hypothetical protein
MMGNANGTFGYFSIHPQNINPFVNAITTIGDSYINGSINPIIIPWDYKISEVHLKVGRCAVAQGTVGSNPTIRIEFFNHSGIDRSAIGFTNVPIDNTNCGIFNNLGNNNFQNSSVIDITDITGNMGDVIGWQFTNRSSTNNDINGIAQCTVLVKIERNII